MNVISLYSLCRIEKQFLNISRVNFEKFGFENLESDTAFVILLQLKIIFIRGEGKRDKGDTNVYILIINLRTSHVTFVFPN